MLRKPAVAGTFYPGDPSRLDQLVRGFLRGADRKEKAFAVVVPHAGYVYSGGVAGKVFSRVEIPRDVVIVGPNHRGMGAAQAVVASGGWQMPGGTVQINEELARTLMDHMPNLKDDPSAHRMEHSLEVQVPFLQALRPDVRIVPVLLSASSYRECEELGTSLAAGIGAYGDEALLVASTDMTHYETHREAEKKDRLAIDRLLAMDPEGLLKTVLGMNISMCGVIPTSVVLTACRKMGATSAELVAYATSGEASGDYEQVVGYAGLIVT